MSELVRAFPGRPVSPGEYGPQAEKLQHTALADLKAVRRGRLAVTQRARRSGARLDAGGQRRSLGGSVRLARRLLICPRRSTALRSPCGNMRKSQRLRGNPKIFARVVDPARLRSLLGQMSRSETP